MNTQNPPASKGALPTLQNFIFDLDGVIWRGNSPIEGAVEAVSQLKAAGKRCFFCTNNSRKEPGEFAARLREVGIEADDADVMTSSLATVFYLESQYTGPFTAYVIGEAGLISMLRRTGSIVTTSPLIPQRSELHGVNEAVDCVVVGIDSAFSYHKMRVAQRLILSGARFIATNRDSTFPTPNGVVPGAGAIVASIETATGVSPIVLGKPQPLMLQLLIQKFNLHPAETAMVGDRIDTDMSAAHRAGIRGLFVATGVHTVEQARRGKGEQKPDGIYADLPSMCTGIVEKAAKVADAFAAAAAFGGAAAAAAAPADEVAAAPVSAFDTLPPDENPLQPVPAQNESPEVTLESLQNADAPVAAASASPFSLDSLQPLNQGPVPPESAYDPGESAEESPFDTSFSWLDEEAAATGSNGAESQTEAPDAAAPDAAATDSPFAFDDLLTPPQSEAAATTTSPQAQDAAAEVQNFGASFAEPDSNAPEAVGNTQPDAQPATNGTNGAQNGEANDKWWDSLDKLV